MNKVIISGNLSKDCKVFVTNNDVTIGKFTVAVNRGFGENQVTTYIPCVLFGKISEKLEKYLLTGAKVNIEGQIDYKSQQDDKGDWHNFFQVIVQDIDIIKFVNTEEDNKKQGKYSRTNRKY